MKITITGHKYQDYAPHNDSFEHAEQVMRDYCAPICAKFRELGFNVIEIKTEDMTV